MRLKGMSPREKGEIKGGRGRESRERERERKKGGRIGKSSSYSAGSLVFRGWL